MGTVCSQSKKMSDVKYYVDSEGDRIYMFLKNKTSKKLVCSVFHTRYSNFSPNWICLAINNPIAINFDNGCLIGTIQNGKGIKIYKILPIGKSIRFEGYDEKEN